MFFILFFACAKLSEKVDLRFQFSCVISEAVGIKDQQCEKREQEICAGKK